MKMTESMKSEVVRLYFEENREEAEIAARLGISLRQAKTVLGLSLIHISSVSFADSSLEEGAFLSDHFPSKQ